MNVASVFGEERETASLSLYHSEVAFDETERALSRPQLARSLILDFSPQEFGK